MFWKHLNLASKKEKKKGMLGRIANPEELSAQDSVETVLRATLGFRWSPAPSPFWASLPESPTAVVNYF